MTDVLQKQMGFTLMLNEASKSGNGQLAREIIQRAGEAGIQITVPAEKPATIASVSQQENFLKDEHYAFVRKVGL